MSLEQNKSQNLIEDLIKIFGEQIKRKLDIFLACHIPEDSNQNYYRYEWSKTDRTVVVQYGNSQQGVTHYPLADGIKEYKRHLDMGWVKIEGDHLKKYSFFDLTNTIRDIEDIPEEYIDIDKQSKKIYLSDILNKSLREILRKDMKD